jgi:hypothetical protein
MVSFGNKYLSYSPFFREAEAESMDVSLRCKSMRQAEYSITNDALLLFSSLISCKRSK